MNINNLGVTSTPLASQPPANAAAGSGEQTSTAAGGTSVYTPSSELTKLIALVQQQADVRPDRVQAALQRLQQGDYHIPSAAEQTALAMFTALD